MQAIDRLHGEVKVAIGSRAPCVDDGVGALSEVEVGGADRDVFGPGKSDVCGHRPRVQVQDLFVRVGQTFDHGATAGANVDGRSGCCVTDGQTGLTGLQCRGVVDERVQRRVAVGVQVGRQGHVRTTSHGQPFSRDGRVLGLGVGTSGIHLDVVVTGRHCQRVSQGAGLKIGKGLVAVDVNVNGQSRHRVQHGHLAVVLSQSGTGSGYEVEACSRPPSNGTHVNLLWVQGNRGDSL